MKAYVLVGKSSRLPGKHLIEVISGKRLIDIVIENIESIGIEVVVYSKIPLDVNAKVIRDRTQWILPSILSLFNLEKSMFVFGGDMPLIKKEAVELMLSKFHGKTLVPRWSKTGYLEPLHAIYSSSVISCLENANSLTNGLKNCKEVEFINAELFPPETFFNVNTVEDLEILRKMLGLR